MRTADGAPRASAAAPPRAATARAIAGTIGLALVVAAALGGCGREVHETGVVRSRLIPDDPGETFGPKAVAISRVVVAFALQSAADLEEWTLEGGRFADVSAAGATIESAESAVALSRELSLEAASVDLVEATIGGINRQEVSLEWTRSDDPACADCRVAVDLGSDKRGRFATYSFQLSRHPEWRGTISGVRLTSEVPRSGVLVVQELRAAATLLDDDRLTEALARPWKVDLEDQVRDCRLGLPGVPVRFEVEVPPRASLSFGYGLAGAATAAVRFTVSVERPDRSPLQLFEAIPDDPEAWSEGRVDLWRLEGQRVTLLLGTEVVEGELDPLQGIPVWSSPVVFDQQPPELPNVVLISIDTLRSDRMSLYGYGRPTSPNLEAWIERRGAAVFESAVAPAPWTLPSHVSMFTGLDAASHGVNYSSPAPSGLLMLAEVLRDAGYATVAFTGGGFVHPQWGFAQGFDRYGYFAVDMGFEDELEVNVEGALRWIQNNRGRRFFMFFHTYEVHNPFRPRQPFFGQFSAHSPRYSLRVDHTAPDPDDGFLTKRAFSLRVPGQQETVSPVPDEFASLAGDLYDAGVAYTDSVLARLLGVLDALNEVRPTVVIVTSDHGEMLGEHGLTNHACLYEENLMVPLIVALPQPMAGERRRIAAQVRLTDIVPTVLELAGLPPLTGLDGASLAPVLAGTGPAPQGPAWSYSPATNYGLSLRRSDGLKYIFKNHPWPSPAEPKEELFRLDRDPGEQHNLAPEDPDLAISREAVRGYLDGRTGRVTVRLFNRSGEVVAGRLRGGMVQPTTLKASVPIAGAFRWQDETATFLVPPGEELALWIEGARDGSLAIDIGLERRGAGSVTLEPGDGSVAGEAMAAVLVGGRWQTVPAEAPEVEAAAAGVVVVREESPWGRDAPSAADIDPALRDQLRALGYVE